MSNEELAERHEEGVSDNSDDDVVNSVEVSLDWSIGFSFLDPNFCLQILKLVLQIL